jgi:hypothetical protein
MIYSVPHLLARALQWGQHPVLVLVTYDNFMFRTKLDLSLTPLSIGSGAH